MRKQVGMILLLSMAVSISAFAQQELTWKADTIKKLTNYYIEIIAFPVFEGEDEFVQRVNRQTQSAVKEGQEFFEQYCKTLSQKYYNQSLPDQVYEINRPLSEISDKFINLRLDAGFKVPSAGKNSAQVLLFHTIGKKDQVDSEDVKALNFHRNAEGSLGFNEVFADEKKVTKLVKEAITTGVKKNGERPEGLLSTAEEWKMYQSFLNKNSFRNFTISQNGVTFWFSPGTIGPGSHGIQSVFISSEEISPLLKKEVAALTFD